SWTGRIEDVGVGTPLVLGVDSDHANLLVATSGGREVDRFAKQLLVPGSERRLLGLGRDRYRPGTGPRLLRLADLRLHPLICYEDLFARASAGARTADLVVAASHDGWNPAAAWAHLAAARLVAVESGRWVVRPTTSGISAAIDPRGRLAWSTTAIDRDAHPEVGAITGVVTVGLPTRSGRGRPGLPRLPVGWLAGAALALSFARRPAAG
ncbi:MAG: hypothetical protein H0V89_11810, partial [Deltaproteobacteria bacterium]|nr:hypothetical protein [Deltaproteobacteria bacterium]